MSQPPRPDWDFDYRPATPPWPEVEGARDVIVAAAAQVPEPLLREALAARARLVSVREVLACPPLFWWRVHVAAPVAEEVFAEAFAAAGADVRYVTPASIGSQRWAPPFAPLRSKPSGSSWSPRPRTEGREPRDGGSWFLGAAGGGVDADRPITGTGAGTRLAVIDDDAAGAAALALDAELLVDLVAPPRAQAHGSLMVAWAVGAARAEPPFRGVAPDASPRLYLIPKPGLSVVSLPLAIVRAVRDGADAIVCATYVEGTWSPLFDDALAYAERCGRAGRGTVVVLPAGREASSPPGSVHASFTLSFGDPAADPRVVCVAPGGHRGGWFFYRDRKQRARPFANRGPSVRLLAPGDDVAYPLDPTGRLSHAESSGASAIAAGVAALVLAVNPTLRLRELIALLETTARDVDPAADPALAPFADLHDTLPSSLDADRHNAKHGYGALTASRACLAAADPVSWALVRIGEIAAARAFHELRARGSAPSAPAYSQDLARWMVRALVMDPRASHAARALVRHARLLSPHPRRRDAFPRGALARQVALLLRGFLEGTAIGPPPPRLRREIFAHLDRIARRPSIELAWIDLAARLFSPPAPRPPAASGAPAPLPAPTTS